MYAGDITMAGTKTFTGTVNMQGTVFLDQLFEKITDLPITTNVMTYTISTGNNSIISNTVPASISNFKFAISNLTAASFTSYTFTLILDVSNTKIFANTMSVNGTDATLQTSGGLTSITINSTTKYVIQQFNVMYWGSTVIPIVFTSVIQLYN